jgi:6-pyruvoyltetrahydropterin/6-carboxytetrahydropterin synthase
VHRIWRSIDISFAHHVRGHTGACVNVHGHTWKFEVCAQAERLDREGFVVDFKHIVTEVLAPIHGLLDHALAVGEDTWSEVSGDLENLGKKLVASRAAIHGAQLGSVPAGPPLLVMRVGGAENRYAGGMKIAVFPWSPTSERLSEWLYGVATEKLADDRTKIAWTRVYETLHPVESVAEFTKR